MNNKNTVIGITIVLLAVWIYAAMSTFKTEAGSDPERLVIREGVIRTEDEVAQKLSDEMGFDLEGAYKTGYTPRHVIEFLIKAPHEFDVTFYRNTYYEKRITILRMIPVSITIFLAIIGIAIAMPKNNFRRTGQ